MFTINSMDSANTLERNDTRSRSESPSLGDEMQRENEERFVKLQNEISSLKFLTEMLISHNEERSRLKNTAALSRSARSKQSDI